MLMGWKRSIENSALRVFHNRLALAWIVVKERGEKHTMRPDS
jgi:hypothetical protein